jgi:hypothetical protein
MFSENLGIVFGGQYVSKPVQNYDLETSKHNLKQPTYVLESVGEHVGFSIATAPCLII